MFASHAIILVILIPFLAAPLAAIYPHARIGWWLAFIANTGALVMSLVLMMQVYETGPVHYALGNWQPPIGIEYRADMFAALMLTLVTGVGVLALLYAYHSVPVEIPHKRQGLFYTIYLLCLAGLCGMVVTNDVFNIFVFLEISSLATYTLIAMGHTRRAILASFEYLVLGTIGATFYLIGIGLLYMATGTLNITDLVVQMAGLTDKKMIDAALVFIVIGLSLKIALFPLHAWLCNAYTYAPSFVSTFLAATATKVSLYVLITLLFTLWDKQMMPIDHIFMGLAVGGILAGSLVAVFQTNIKRMLAYSSISQIGYIVLGVSLASAHGLTASVLHIVNHAFAKAGLFMAIGCVAFRQGRVELMHLRGIGKQMPVTMGIFVISGLSLIGIPLTAGFTSKWYLLQAIAEEQLWWVLGVVVISSLLTVIYIGRVIEVAYFKEPVSEAQEVPAMMLLPALAMVVLSLLFGVYTMPVMRIVARIVSDWI